MNEQYDFQKNIENMSPEEVTKQEKRIKAMILPAIELLDFLYDESGDVTYETNELTSLCPMTGLPDFYTLRITYTPARHVPELKSLKIYLLSFRNIPILHEHLACRIFDDFHRAVAPRTLKIELDAHVRGGIHASIVKET